MKESQWWKSGCERKGRVAIDDLQVSGYLPCIVKVNPEWKASSGEQNDFTGGQP